MRENASGLAGFFCLTARLGRPARRIRRRCFSASSKSAVRCNWPDTTASSLKPGYPTQGVVALKDILKKIGAVDNFSGEWQLPTPNPFLRTEAPAPNAGLIRGQTSKHRGLRTFAQDRSRSRRENSLDAVQPGLAG